MLKWSRCCGPEMWVLFLILLSLTDCTLGLCPDNHFFNLEQGICKKCSTCAENDIIRRTCSFTNDTLCGKVSFAFIENRVEVHNEKIITESPYVVSLDEDQLYWRNLAYALIIVLSLTVVISSVCVLVACYRFRQTGRFCKSIAREQEDAESGYVVIHKFIPDLGSASPAEGRNQYVGASSTEAHPSGASPQLQQSQRRYRAYRPKRRLMNEYVDDVFESDDSSGSRTLRLALEPIPEKSEGRD